MEFAVIVQAEIARSGKYRQDILSRLQGQKEVVDSPPKVPSLSMRSELTLRLL